jgi:hypothetical protein
MNMNHLNDIIKYESFEGEKLYNLALVSTFEVLSKLKKNYLKLIQIYLNFFFILIQIE